MYKLISKQIFIFLIGTLLIPGCSEKSKKDDFDLSGLKIPKKTIPLEIDQLKKEEKKEVEIKLIPLKDRKEISSSIKYGKKDPFSSLDNESNKFIEDFKLKGFISFKKKDHALVEYKKKSGIINLKSVGGLNTEMLPKKAYVKDIIPSQEKINLSVEGEIYTIELNL